MHSTRSQIIHWAEQGLIRPARLGDALRTAGAVPRGQDWQRFLDRVLLWGGAVSLAAAVVFFIAYNWDALGRFARFGLAEALPIAALGWYAWRGPERASARAALFGASLLVGALLALYGQVYQTGADTWELFATWAALILPWVVLGRLPALWLVWLALLNLATLLYFSVFPGLFAWLRTTERMLLLLFALNTAALLAWELAATRLPWLAPRWAIRLVAAASAASATVLALFAIFDWRDNTGAALVLYPLWLCAAYLVYRRALFDLFMLALSCASAIAVIAGLIGKQLFRWDEATGFLVLSVALVAMSAVVAIWLRRIAGQDDQSMKRRV
jgi:uncharacterized membrane protein